MLKNIFQVMWLLHLKEYLLHKRKHPLINYPILNMKKLKQPFTVINNSDIF